jgi:hypothetical protein
MNMNYWKCSRIIADPRIQNIQTIWQLLEIHSNGITFQQKEKTMDAQETINTIRYARQNLPYMTKQDDKQASINLLRKLLMKSTYEDAVYWIGRLQANFPARQTENDAVVKSDVAGDCVDEGLPICALAWVCDELRNEATKQDPFMPPSGEIIQRTRVLHKKWQDLLTSLENPPVAAIEKRENTEVRQQGRTCTDPHGKEKARIIVEGLKRGIGPQQALAEGGF